MRYLDCVKLVKMKPSAIDMRDYWIPQFKWQLVDWFLIHEPASSKRKWERMSKKELYGKYKEVRDGLVR